MKILLSTLLLLPLSFLPRQQIKATPKAAEFTDLVIDIIREYPTSGKNRYYWPRGKCPIKNWYGNTRKMVYNGKTLAEGHPKGSCYCCGITFEVFFRAWEEWCNKEKRPFDIMGLDFNGLRRLRSHWFGSNGDNKCVGGAIPGFGLGKAVSLKDAKPGDFVQLWRNSGSGHSVVFMGWIKNAKGKPREMIYWSTQGATNGIGYRVESIGGPRGINLKKTYIVRIGS